MSPLDRRDFLKIAGAHAGILITGCASAPGFLRSAGASSHVVVVGAGAFGGWTALNLRRMGARVTLVDMLGPGNSRSTSGDETRGVRTSYGDRPHGELWMRWANQAIDRWKEWDAEYARPLRMRVFFTTGDVVLRGDWEPYVTTTREWWEKNAIPHEVLSIEELRRRWPVIAVDEMNVALYEPNAGVVRSRRACEAVAEVFRHEGGRLAIGRVIPPEPGTFNGTTIRFTDATTLGADAFVFACGPWLGKTFTVLANKIRTPLGSVFYYGTPLDDQRFSYPNLPSWNFPGVTGWPALPVDSRGFRVRTGGATGSDPDTSARWIDPERLQRPRDFVTQRFPLLQDAPLLETRACHYELSVSRNFIIDRHPEMPNVWVAGGGSAEGFKFGPMIGEYVARRVLGKQTDPEIDAQFRIPAEDFEEASERKP